VLFLRLLIPRHLHSFPTRRSSDLSITEDFVWWGDVNHPFSIEDFDRLYNRVTAFLSHREIYIKDVQAGSKKDYQLNVRVITETRSEEHTSELQSRENLVCRLLLEK